MSRCTFSFVSSACDATEFGNVSLYMREQSLRFAEPLVADCTVVVRASFQFTEWPLARWFWFRHTGRVADHMHLSTWRILSQLPTVFEVLLSQEVLDGETARLSLDILQLYRANRHIAHTFSYDFFSTFRRLLELRLGRGEDCGPNFTIPLAIAEEEMVIS